MAPSSVRIRTNSTAAVTVYAQRKDGFTGSIRLELKDPPEGFSAAPVKLAAGQNNASLTIKGPSSPTKEPLSLSVVGRGKTGEKEIAHEAVPADDRMQAFLWRHLVPAKELTVLVWDPAYEPGSRRVIPVRRPSALATNAVALTNAAGATNAEVVSEILGLADGSVSEDALADWIRRHRTKRRSSIPKFR